MTQRIENGLICVILNRGSKRLLNITTWNRENQLKSEKLECQDLSKNNQNLIYFHITLALRRKNYIIFLNLGESGAES